MKVTLELKHGFSPNSKVYQTFDVCCFKPESQMNITNPVPLEFVQASCFRLKRNYVVLGTPVLCTVGSGLKFSHLFWLVTP